MPLFGLQPWSLHGHRSHYHFSGPKHTFKALVHVEQTALYAAIIGVVTDGWLKGKMVEGRYTQIICTHGGLTTDCFQGNLKIGRD